MNTISGQEQPVTAPSCSRCSRKGWKDVFACPERSAGNCLFVEERRWHAYDQTRIFTILACAALAVMLSLLLKPPAAINILLGLLVVAVFWLARTTTVQLREQGSGVKLRRTTLWGVELSWARLTPSEQVPIDLTLPQQLHYPPSILMLPGEPAQSANDTLFEMLRANLMSLFASKQIQIHRHQVNEIKRGKLPTEYTEYLIHRVGLLDASDLDGWLEKQIQMALSELSVNSVGTGCAVEPTLETALKAILDKDKSSAAKRWIAKVSSDAVRLGLGQVKREWLHEYFAWNEAVAAQIEREHDMLLALIQQLGELQPDLAATLDRAILLAIKAHNADAC